MTVRPGTAVVACQQIAPQVGDPAGNRILVARALEEAVTEGADVIVLPELSTSGYVFGTHEEVREAALTRDDPVFSGWATLLGGTRAIAVVGFAELAADGRIHNSAAVLDAGGLVEVYRKTHLWDREKSFFTPGDALPPVVETQVGRVGIAICYDLEFPEVVRHLATQGADLIAVPTNWPQVPRLTGGFAPEVVIAMALARVNRVAIACCDRAGRERGQEWTRGTSVVDQTGNVIGAREDEGLLTVAVDLAGSRDKRIAEGADVFGDRRTDLYGGPPIARGTA